MSIKKAICQESRSPNTKEALANWYHQYFNYLARVRSYSDDGYGSIDAFIEAVINAIAWRAVKRYPTKGLTEELAKKLQAYWEKQ